MSQRPWPFYSVGAAVRWADRLLTTPPVRSQLGVRGTDPVDELGTAREVAMTVSVAVANSGEGAVVRAVHGEGREQMQELAQRLADATWQGTGRGTGGVRTMAQARALALHVLKDERRRHQGRPRRLLKTAMTEMGIPADQRTTYHRVWAEVESAMRETVALWLRQGEGEVAEKLSAAGVV